MDEARIFNKLFQGQYVLSVRKHLFVYLIFSDILEESKYLIKLNNFIPLKMQAAVLVFSKKWCQSVQFCWLCHLTSRLNIFLRSRRSVLSETLRSDRPEMEIAALYCSGFRGQLKIQFHVWPRCVISKPSFPIPSAGFILWWIGSRW